MKALSRGRGNPGSRWGWVVNATPRPLYPGKEIWYPLYRRLVGLHCRTGLVRKFLLTRRFDVKSRPLTAFKGIHVQTKYARQLNTQANKDQSTYVYQFEEQQRKYIINIYVYTYKKYETYITQCCDNFVKFCKNLTSRKFLNNCITFIYF
jgi:hypothetical protein